jgi:hypothetical protein
VGVDVYAEDGFGAQDPRQVGGIGEPELAAGEKRPVVEQRVEPR